MNQSGESDDYPGSRWWRFDLHTHSAASSDFRESELSPLDWLVSFMRAGIDAVAITDHNTSSGIAPLQTALAALKARPESERPNGYRELVLFPGVEITTSDGVHLLAIFDPSSNASQIDQLLGKVGCPAHDRNAEAMCTGSSADVCIAIAELHGIAIAAHANDRNGVLEASADDMNLRRGAREIDLVLEHLHALQIVDGKRAHWTARHDALAKRFAFLSASDSHQSAHAGRDSTWIKCTKPTLQGLRLALLDHQLAVRAFDPLDNPNKTPAYWVREIHLENLMLRRAAPLNLKLNPAFNALIGGRGTGKSTLIEATRLAGYRTEELTTLGDNSEVREAFKRFNAVSRQRDMPGMLQPNTRISLIYVRNGQEAKLSFDQSGEMQAVQERAENGVDWIPRPGLTPSQIAERFPLRILSQKQVYELSRNSRALLELVDNDPRLSKAQWQREFDDLVRQFKALRAHYRVLNQRISNQSVQEDARAQTERKLKAFEQSNVGAQLKAYQIAKRQRDGVEGTFLAAERFINRLEQSIGELSGVNALSSSDFQVETPAQSELLQRMQSLADTLNAVPNRWRTEIVNLRSSLSTARAEIGDLTWNSEVQAVLNQFETLLQSMRDQGINSPKEYGELAQQKQKLEAELVSLNAERARAEELLASANEIRKQLIEKRQQLSEKRKEFIERYIQPTTGAIRLLINPCGDIDSAEDALRTALALEKKLFEVDVKWQDDSNSGGVVHDIYSGGVPLARWCAACEAFDGKKEVVLATSLQKKLLSKLEKAKPEQFDDLLVQFPEDELILEYRQGNDFKKVNQGSAGQRSAAVLAFLLAFGEEPMLLDQPEDDLDNALVYELVVQGIRTNKAHRQLIISTHNSNIVVNGDAEYVVPMRFENGSIDADLTSAGGLQEERVRRKICEIMEGGKQAFEQRYKKVLKDLR